MRLRYPILGKRAMNVETQREMTVLWAISTNQTIISGASDMSKSILLIDDDCLFRGDLGLFLESNGFSCREAENGLKALKLLDVGLEVDLIISDYHLPIINGPNFLKALTYRMNGQNIRMIFLSGNLTEDMKLEAKHAGAFGVHPKPYDHQAFLELVSRGFQY